MRPFDVDRHPVSGRVEGCKMRLRGFGRGIALVALFACAGCDAAFFAEAPAQNCQQVARQCQLAKGPLGVCERAVCEEGEEGPCFVCTPQH
ncbi:MAG: hypothetical protein AB8G23_07180 [Myxococcota bacterium]